MRKEEEQQQQQQVVDTPGQDQQRHVIRGGTDEAPVDEKKVRKQQQQQQQQQQKLAKIFQQLIEACKLKDLAAIRLLLADRPELVNQRDKQDRSLLHYAVIQVGDQQESANALECFDFLQECADQRLWSHQDRDGLGLLHLAVISANKPLVEHLAEGHPLALRRPLVGALDRERHSPLHWAVITSSLASVRALVRAAGVGLAHEPDLNGATPLHYATQTCDFPRYRVQLRRLLAGGEPMRGLPARPESREPEEGGEEGGAKGVLAGNCEILEFLLGQDGIQLECEDRDKRTPLLWAASSGNWMALDLLLEHGANPLSCDANSLSALHCAASRAHLGCLESLLGPSPAGEGELRVGQRKGRKLVEPDQLRDKLNCTALFYAVLGANVDCIELLLERGAAPDWQDSKGRTASHFAALRGGQLGALKLLQARGANLWLANKLGDLPLHYAVKSGRQQVVHWLLETSPYEQAVSAINNLGRSPIHLAVQRNDPALLSYLLQCKPHLAQLAKIKGQAGGNLSRAPGKAGSSSQRHRYETALDTAERLGRQECASLLIGARAPRATQVLSERAQLGRAIFKSLDTESPIGFETSCSEALDPAGSRPCSDDLTLPNSSPAVAKDPIPTTTGGASENWSPIEFHQQHLQDASSKPEKDLEQPLASDSTNLRTGRRNDRQLNVNLSGFSRSSRSSPTSRIGQTGQTGRSAPVEAQVEQRARIGRAQAALLQGREVITNVNVYTAPCQQCTLANKQHWHQPPTLSACSCSTSPALSYQVKAVSSEVATTCGEDEDDEDLEEGATSDSEKSPLEPHDLPNLVDVGQHHQLGHSRSSSGVGLAFTPQQRSMQRSSNVFQTEQVSRLPVILSEREQSSNSSSPTIERWQQQQQQYRSSEQLAGPLAHLCDTPFEGSTISSQTEMNKVASKEESKELDSSRRTMCSPANEVPRFDRFSRDTSRLPGIKRPKAVQSSPVADYIHSSSADYYYPQVEPDFSLRHRVLPAISKRLPEAYKSARKTPLQSPTRRPPNYSSSLRSQVGVLSDQRLGQLPTTDRVRSKSQSRCLGGSNAAGYTTREGEQQVMRSVSRQTVIKTRRLSVDSVELASRVEKAIRKYKQETKLFEELQNLKRNQIRSGRANEALLVKRLVEGLRANTSHLLGLDSYSGPYTYKSYERFLYDQLRKLSLSNRAKLSPIYHHHQRHHHHHHHPAGLSSPSGAPLQPRGGANSSMKQPAEESTLSSRNTENGQCQFDGFNLEDPTADLELRRIISSQGRESPCDLRINSSDQLVARETSDEESCSLILESTGALEDIRVKGKSGKNASAIKLERETVHKRLQRDSTTLDSESEVLHDAQEGQQVSQPLVEGTTNSLLLEEANLLSSAILVDALGNVFKTTSTHQQQPDPQGKSLEQEGRRESKLHAEESSRPSREHITEQFSSEEENLSSHLHAADEKKTTEEPKVLDVIKDKETNHSTVTQEVTEDKQEEDEAEKQKVIHTDGRRRSVINIGDKIDIVYHDVGIEIDKVSDRKPSFDEYEQVRSGAVSSSAELKVEQGAKVKSKGVNLLDGVSEEEEKEEEREPADNGKQKEVPKSLCELDKEGGKSKHVTPNDLSLRRASSPPIYGARETLSLMNYPDNRRAQLKRSISADRDPSMSSEILNLKSHLADSETGQNKVMERSEELRGQVAESSSNSEIEKSSEILVQDQAVQSDLLTETSEDLSKSPPGRKRNLSPLTKRHREMSRVPSHKYKPQVPLEEIKLRWAQIKARERSAIAGEEIPNGSNNNLLACTTDEQRQEQENNYTLIYEINAGNYNHEKLLASSSGATTSLKSTNQTNWCQRRIARIVDVRSVKRTLSLPECLIYSNDLLKRFNILKL